jgi:glycerate-2-kinase
VVLAAGKAACAMAEVLEDLAEDRIAAGLAVTKDGHALPLRRIAVREAGHPVPDARSEAAAREALALVSAARAEDVLLVLLSGGASSLLTCPLPGLRLADLAETTAMLLAAGAEIDELNGVRKHLAELTGGRLAQHAATHRIEVFVVSDVPGDRLDVIASGPCAADRTRFEDAVAVLERCGLLERVPVSVRAHLESGVRGQVPESLGPGDPQLARVRTSLLASNRDARAAAALAAERRGLRAVPLGEGLHGEARTAGRCLAALGRAVRGDAPVCLVAGGETAVTVRGPGRGGRNQELALAAALDLAGDARVALLAVGTDGSDGPTDAAGAYADGGTLERAAKRGIDGREALERNDSHGFFVAEGGVVRTGPTRTNVMDLALVLVSPAARSLEYPLFRSVS